jgi:hypothetical protein
MAVFVALFVVPAMIVFPAAVVVFAFVRAF